MGGTSSHGLLRDEIHRSRATTRCIRSRTGGGRRRLALRPVFITIAVEPRWEVAGGHEGPNGLVFLCWIARTRVAGTFFIQSVSCGKAAKVRRARCRVPRVVENWSH